MLSASRREQREMRSSHSSSRASRRRGTSPTRTLDLFEAAALPVLQRGEDLARERKGDQLRILGSIRAGQPCLKCHEAQRGDLLGAFSYALRREPSQP